MSDYQPEQVGDYILGKTIGKGQYGKVKKAHHTRTNQEVAIKIIKRSKVLARDQSMLEREVRIHKLLRHPHIVNVQDFLEPDGGKTLYVVCEYCPRGQIFDYVLAHGRLREGEARRFFRQLVSAVDYCHSFGFVHRDIKLENILLDKEFRIKLTDFGFSRMFDSEHYLKTSCGSPLYASPEVLNGHPYRGPEVDLWSLGVVLYAFVVGAMPYMCDTPAALRAAVNSGQRFTPSTHLNPSCEALVSKLLTIDGTRRMRMSDLREDPWMLDDQQRPVPAHQPEYANVTPDDADESFVFILQRLGFTDDDINRQLFAQEPTQVRAIYRLMEARAPQEPQRSGSHENGLDDARGTLRRKRRNTIQSSAKPAAETPSAGATRTTMPDTAASAAVPALAQSPHVLTKNPLVTTSLPPMRRHRRHSTDTASPGGTPPRPTINTLDVPPPGSPGGSAPAAEPLRRRGSAVGVVLRPIAEEPGAGRVHNIDDVPELVRPLTTGGASEASSSPHSAAFALRSPTPSDASTLDIPHMSGRRTSTPEVRTLMREKAEKHQPQTRRRFTNDGTSPKLPVLAEPLEESTTMVVKIPLHHGRSADALPTILSQRRRRTAEFGVSLTVEAPDGTTDRSTDDLHEAAHLHTDLNIARVPPRPARVPLSKDTTSAKSPDDLFSQVKDVLRRKGISYDEQDDDLPGSSGYLLTCHHKDVEFEIEVCRVPRLSLHCLRFSLRSGDMWRYKEIHNSIVPALEL